jgi:hypothetical protein
MMKKYDAWYDVIEDDSRIKFKVVYENIEATSEDDAYELAEDLVWASFHLAEYTFDFDRVEEKPNA